MNTLPAIGTKFAVLATVERPARNGETIYPPDGPPFKLLNRRGDKFWATLYPGNARVLCCLSPDFERLIHAAKAVQTALAFEEVPNRP